MAQLPVAVVDSPSLEVYKNRVNVAQDMVSEHGGDGLQVLEIFSNLSEPKIP